MPSQHLDEYIHIKGAREHNLKNLEIRIPRGKFIVITGVSGSGKSSLAFDTLYAEGYRKYMESLSVSARQMLNQITRPDVDFIHGLSPVIAIEQRRGGGGNPRSTVATVTEIADYAGLIWARCGAQFCPLDGGSIVRRSVDDCIDQLIADGDGKRLMLLAPILTARSSVLREELPRLRIKGFQRVRIDGEIRELDEPNLVPTGRESVAVDLVIDRTVVRADQRSRLADSLEVAFKEGGDRAIALIEDGASEWREVILAQKLACAKCGTVYDDLSPRHFSWNHAQGACNTCGGLGVTRQFRPELVIPDPEKSVRGGAIKPWRLGSKNMIIERNSILRQLAEQLPFDPTVPWRDLPSSVRELLLHGDGQRLFQLRKGRGKAATLPFGGVLTDLEETVRSTSSDGLRARMMAFQSESTCPDCGGRRLGGRSRAVRVGGVGFADFLGSPVAKGLTFVEGLRSNRALNQSAAEALRGLENRLRFLHEVGLGYLTLDREFGTLSGGESQRVRLATQLGMGLVGVLFVLDEPSIGLHPRDTRQLIDLLTGLRERGNTVVVVEHDEMVMAAADHLLELGPGPGEAGGEVVFQGSVADCCSAPQSRVGDYLGGRTEVAVERGRRETGDQWLVVKGAAEHNLKSIDVRFPVGLLTTVCGVSGSGKSTLVNDILARAAAFRLNRARSIPGRHGGIAGLEYFSSVVVVDQSPIGRSPRSNPATFVKVFDLLRQLYAQCPLSRIRGYSPSRFSFNVRGGRCERCQGDGMIRLDMQFLDDVFVECPSCNGRRYNRETLEVRFRGLSIADVLDLSIDEAREVFGKQPRIRERLDTLTAVGLGYLRLGQSATTLSGGEAQRIKLSLELSRRQQGETLYILDEPTTGLHWDDVQRLLDLLFQLRDAGNSIILIEHQPDVIRLSDYVIELGPEGGDGGGQLVFSGLPEDLAQCPGSPTGKAVKAMNRTDRTNRTDESD